MIYLDKINIETDEELTDGSIAIYVGKEGVLDVKANSDTLADPDFRDNLLLSLELSLECNKLEDVCVEGDIEELTSSLDDALDDYFRMM